ncbi:hypothetical protein GCK32_017165 [Trichostrongylus colubriformis]|uniref:Uncharacterized protein n=1 Tax=Trichostrongylus colubriformis TaxID=6319 RepID=A0AAN8ESH9_TRICO
MVRSSQPHRPNGKGRSERFPLPSYLDPLVRILSRNRSIDGTPEKEDLSIDLQEIAKEEINSSDEELADGPLFEPERKPTLDELLTHNSERWSRTDKVSTTQRGTHENHAPEAATTSAKVIGTLPKSSLTGEVLSCFSDSLSQLLDEEVKLAKIRQEEAAMAIEVRRLEIEKLNLEIEWLRKRADSEASNGLCSPYYIQ